MKLSYETHSLAESNPIVIRLQLGPGQKRKPLCALLQESE